MKTKLQYYYPNDIPGLIRAVKQKDEDLEDNFLEIKTITDTHSTLFTTYHLDGDYDWDDLRFPASGINPAGAPSPPNVDTVNGGTLLFPDTGAHIIGFVAQLPHTWREGTTLHPHCHWQKTTSASGNVMWRFSYKWAPINAVMDAAFTVSSATTTVAGTPDTNTADKHLITAFTSISATGKKISDMLVCTLERVGSDGTDTYGANARLLEIDIHYQVDSFGSDAEFVK